MKTFKIFFYLGFIFLSFASLAQGAPPATPIDGGLSILLAVGGAYGIKRVMEARKKTR